MHLNKDVHSNFKVQLFVNEVESNQLERSNQGKTIEIRNSKKFDLSDRRQVVVELKDSANARKLVKSKKTSLIGSLLSCYPRLNMDGRHGAWKALTGVEAINTFGRFGGRIIDDFVPAKILVKNSFSNDSEISVEELKSASCPRFEISKSGLSGEKAIVLVDNASRYDESAEHLYILVQGGKDSDAFLNFVVARLVSNIESVLPDVNLAKDASLEQHFENVLDPGTERQVHRSGA